MRRLKPRRSPAPLCEFPHMRHARCMLFFRDRQCQKCGKAHAQEIEDKEIGDRPRFISLKNVVWTAPFV